MTNRILNAGSMAIALAAAVGALVLDHEALTHGKLAVSSAQARVGRPATPVSYAGVARRTTRRAVAVGAAAATTACVQKVDAYGRVVTVCR